MVLFKSIPSEELNILRSNLPDSTSSLFNERFPWIYGVLISHNATDDLNHLTVLHDRRPSISESDREDISSYFNKSIPKDFALSDLNVFEPVDNLETAQCLSKAKFLVGDEHAAEQLVDKCSGQLVARMQATWDAATTMNSALNSINTLQNCLVPKGDHLSPECEDQLDAIRQFMHNTETFHDDFPGIAMLRRLANRNGCDSNEGESFTEDLPLSSIHNQMIQYIKNLTGELDYYREGGLDQGSAPD